MCLRTRLPLALAPLAIVPLAVVLPVAQVNLQRTLSRELEGRCRCGWTAISSPRWW